MSFRLWWATVFVSDIGRAVEFYRDVLGMHLRFADDGYASFRAGPGLVDLSAELGPVGIRTGIGLGVSDLDTVYESLIAKGVRFVQPPTKRPWGDYDAVISDPDGNEIILDHMPHELSEEYLNGRVSEAAGGVGV